MSDLVMYISLNLNFYDLENLIISCKSLGYIFKNIKSPKKIRYMNKKYYWISCVVRKFSYANNTSQGVIIKIYDTFLLKCH